MDNALLTDDLFEKILLNPAKGGANELYIVSGYASSAMAFHHAEKLLDVSDEISIKLIIGMTSRDGLSRTNHLGFKELMEKDLAGKFECSYIHNHVPVHSKTYAWLCDGNPCAGFVGSANYSQQAFLIKNQKEVATICDPNQTHEYFCSLIDHSLLCNHQEAEFVLDLYKSYKITEPEMDQLPNQPHSLSGLPHITVSFLSKGVDNEVPTKSGLNWGQRPGRNPDQAYIQLPQEVYSSDYFPIKATHFSVSTDDGKYLVCSRAQKDWRGHAIETPHNNSLLGVYFRNRLGLASGTLVTREHLEKYGRTDVVFYKIDEENYYMDFSQP